MNKTKTASIDAIKTAIEALNKAGKKITQANISSETGLSTNTIQRNWEHIKATDLPSTEDMKATHSKNKATVSSIDVKDKATVLSKQGDIEHKKISNRVTLKSGFERFKQRANGTPTTFTPFTIDKL